MPTTLIITVYKDYIALQRVLDSVCKQTQIPAQVIIAHDAIDDPIHQTIDRFKSTLQINYINQVDTGFNKNRILNKAILLSTGNKLVFIDGDCILHPAFIAAHQTYISEGTYTAGRRLDLDAVSSTLIRTQGINSINLIRLLFNKTKRIEEGIYLPGTPIQRNKPARLLGCNMGWHKNDLIALNGFDMDYILPGYGEDTDIEHRASLLGLRTANMRWKAIQYHLFHERPEREEDITQSRMMFEKKKEIGYYFCEHGLSNLDLKFPHE
ncbi:MAG: glycosyltransferase [Flavobacteriales bacterium]